MKRRRGITVVIVLLLLSVTLSLSYSIMRSQAVAVQVQSNSDRRNLAHQAAISGLTAALRKMHGNSWAGVDTTLSGNITGTESYRVQYSAGDASLSPSSPDFAEYPYRVTLLSTGYSRDPAHPEIESSCQLEAVVRLVPRALGTQPSGWSDTQTFTVYQLDTDPFSVDVPCRIEGALRVQGEMALGKGYAWTSATRSRFLSDLNAMRGNGYPDLRPLTGPVSLNYARTDATTRGDLTALGVAVTDVPESARPTFNIPSTLVNYRVYSGGPKYLVQQLGTTLKSTQLEPDPLTNPLGIYFVSSPLSLGDNVTVRGTLITAAEMTLTGKQIQISSFDLPALTGTTTPVRLPALVSRKEVSVAPATSGSIQGVVVARDRFLIDQGPASTTFTVQGRIIADSFALRERTEWDLESTTWDALWSSFNTQWSLTGGVKYFPVWTALFGLDPVPVLTIKPDATPHSAHWQNMANPIYVAHPDDGGLRWELLRWTELP